MNEGLDPVDETIIGLSQLQAADEHARANHDRLMLILRGYFAQHAENRDEGGCPCRWCLEARAFLS